MIVVLASFILADRRTIQELGLGLAGGILVDAAGIRSAIVPSLMLILGRANWWMPRWLDRAVPRIHVRATSEGTPARGGGAAGSKHDATEPELIMLRSGRWAG